MKVAARERETVCVHVPTLTSCVLSSAYYIHINKQHTGEPLQNTERKYQKPWPDSTFTSQLSSLLFALPPQSEVSEKTVYTHVIASVMLRSFYLLTLFPFACFVCFLPAEQKTIVPYNRNHPLVNNVVQEQVESNELLCEVCDFAENWVANYLEKNGTADKIVSAR